LSQLDKFLYEHKLVYFYARIKIINLYKKYQPETSRADIFYTGLYNV